MKENHPVVLGQSHASADVSSSRRGSRKGQKLGPGPAAAFPKELRAGFSDGGRETGPCAEECGRRGTLEPGVGASLRERESCLQVHSLPCARGSRWPQCGQKEDFVTFKAVQRRKVLP